MKIRLPWQRQETPAVSSEKQPCTHPRLDVEMHGTAIKRRWCTICGADLPVLERFQSGD
jgi:hypothetical protein